MKKIVKLFCLTMLVVLFAYTSVIALAEDVFEERTTEENPTVISWECMAGNVEVDKEANTIEMVSGEFGVTPMAYCSRGEGAYSNTPFSGYNDTEFRFDFQINPVVSYIGLPVDDEEAGEWYGVFSFRNSTVGALGQEWEANYACFLIFREYTTCLRISSGSSARSNALEVLVPRLENVGGEWQKTDNCVDYLDNKTHSVAISLLDDCRTILVKIDNETVFDVNLDTYQDGKYSSFTVEEKGGYQFQAMGCDALFSNVKIWGNNLSKNIIIPTGIELNYTTYEMDVGDSFYIRGKKIPTNAESRIVWESSDPSIVEVDETGRVTALKPAESVVVTGKIDGYDDIKATCTIKIKGEETAKKKGCGGFVGCLSVMSLGLMTAFVIKVSKKKGLN